MLKSLWIISFSLILAAVVCLPALAATAAEPAESGVPESGTADSGAADYDDNETLAEETYGKSSADILAMGQVAWFEFYTDHAGFSTMDMAMASALYTDAARERNAGLDPGYYSEALRQLLYDLGERALTIGPTLSRGGTIWITIGAGMPADAEDVVYALRGGEMPPVPAMSTGQVERRIDQLEAQIMSTAADPQNQDWFDPAGSLAELRALRADFRAVCALAAELPRADSDRVLAFCDNWIAAVTEYGEEE